MAGTAAVGLLALAAACGSGDTRPCNDCPNVDGTWQLTFEQGAALSSECVALKRGLPEGLLTVTQVGSALSSTLDGVAIRGTLYETYDFSLNGASESDAGTSTVSLTGRFVPSIGAADAGERLQGSYTGTFERGSATCIVSRGYTAQRAP